MRYNMLNERKQITREVNGKREGVREHRKGEEGVARVKVSWVDSFLRCPLEGLCLFT